MEHGRNGVDVDRRSDREALRVADVEHRVLVDSDVRPVRGSTGECERRGLGDHRRRAERFEHRAQFGHRRADPERCEWSPARRTCHRERKASRVVDTSAATGRPAGAPIASSHSIAETARPVSLRRW